ncbi:SCO2400 family protein [Streptomyces caniferus]|uniref:Uncharacterized protein n=2 Tax=Streptomyces caniferus TaxID=285557 RepID=A0A640SJ84_9ACTN|nr:hypothetical protein Scani_72980 [Streptomyces caniferus]
MDYCSSCRRNLNGALVCPGCGDYAPDIAPPSHRRERAMSTAARWEALRAEEAAAGRRQGAHQHTLTQPFEASVFGSGAAAEDVPVDAAGDGSSDGTAGAAAGTGQGRAARRRQLARWKKHRRRAAAATAFALVGGGLTVSLLQNKPSAGHAQAASSPEPGSVGTPRTESAASSSEQPDAKAARHPDAHPHRSAVRPDSAPATPSAATTPRQPHHDAPAHPHAAPDPTRHSTTPGSSGPAHTGHTDAATPAPSAPASTGHSHDAVTSPSDSAPATSPAPSTPTAPAAEPTSPGHVCLLGLVCVD